MIRQIRLPLGFKTDYRRDNFIAGRCNQAALDWIELWPNWGCHASWLWGPEGSGKTHLAEIWAERANAAIADKAANGDALLDVLWRGQNLVLDNVLGWLDETTLFHVLNAAKNGNNSILLTATVPVSATKVNTPDLRSRLQALPQIGIDAPDDEMLQMLATKLLADRQLRVDAQVIDYAILRLPRSFGAVQQFVATVDEFSLANRRGVTLSLVRQVLSLPQFNETNGYE